MTNDDLKRFYPQNSTPEKSNDFVRYNANGEIPGVGQGGGEHETVIIDAPVDSTNGNLTEQQLAILQANDSNVLMFADEIYRLSDKRTSEGYLIYSHACQDNTNNFYIKCITITISTLAWVLTENNVASKDYVSESIANASGKKYQHNITIRNTGLYESNKFEVTLSVITNDNTLFTIETLRDWLYTKGFTSESIKYTASGGSFSETIYSPLIGVYASSTYITLSLLTHKFNTTTIDNVTVVTSMNNGVGTSSFNSSTTFNDLVIEI